MIIKCHHRQSAIRAVAVCRRAGGSQADGSGLPGRETVAGWAFAGSNPADVG
jgi:hypothetical protein